MRGLDLVDVPDGLTRRARTFVSTHCVRVDALDVAQHRERWLGFGIPQSEIDRVAEFQRRWGGLVLPPTPVYDGGPRYLNADTPEGSAEDGWWFEAGVQRTALPYSFMIGPTGELGIQADNWTPLHATVEGWVEAVALGHHAVTQAQHITRLTGDEVDDLPLGDYELVSEVEGLADSWWRSDDELIAVYTGEAECFAAPELRSAVVYAFAPTG